jgi:hypothetical protein
MAVCRAPQNKLELSEVFFTLPQEELYAADLKPGKTDSQLAGAIIALLSKRRPGVVQSRSQVGHPVPSDDIGPCEGHGGPPRPTEHAT